MPDISLRLPYLIYLSIASILLGVLLSPIFRPAPALTTPETMRDHAMMHGSLEIQAEGAPEITIEVTKDPMDGWNVRLITENFTFTPQTVNSENVLNTGHAHLYVNDVKIARLYSPNFHIPDLPIGQASLWALQELPTVDGKPATQDFLKWREKQKPPTKTVSVRHKNSDADTERNNGEAGTHLKIVTGG